MIDVFYVRTYVSTCTRVGTGSRIDATGVVHFQF